MSKDTDKPSVPGKNGGKLFPQQVGEPAPPNAGRKKNAFKEAIQRHGEGAATAIVTDGLIVEKDAAGKSVVTNKRVRVQIHLPAIDAIVVKMFKQAAQRGDVAAARWLSETGYGKNIGEDETVIPAFQGFKFVVEDRRTQNDESSGPTDWTKSNVGLSPKLAGWSRQTLDDQPGRDALQ